MNRFPKRKKIRLPLDVYNQNHAFFITVGTHQNHAWFKLYPRLCETAVQIMRYLSTIQQIRIYAWCIMPDHVHLLIQGAEIINFIRVFKGKLTPFARTIDPKRRLWQRSFFDHALRSEESLHKVASYIWENPVRKDIVRDPLQYQWSGSEVWPSWRKYYQGGDKPRPYKPR